MACPSQCPEAAFAPASRRGLLRRFYDAVMDSRRRHAEREVVRFLGRTGGRLTDDIERQITERLWTSGWNRRG